MRLGEGDNARAVLVPASVWARLVAAAGTDAARDAGRAFGEVLGERLASALGTGTLVGGTIEAAVSALAGELAVVGLGALSLERWGKALVLVIDASPLGDAQPALDAFVAAVLEGTLARATRRDVHVRPLARDGALLRTLVGSAAAVARLGQWLDDGVPWGDALTRLHAREAAA